MGEILAFAPRPSAGDWSANERGLLLLLTQQLSDSYGEVDGVFGQTDSGDPWYVVTDANQDVLVHIARIDGQFVVHDAAIDMFHQVGSLWTALRQVLSSGATEEPGGVVVAFNPASREAQSFLSLVIAVGLYLELRDVDFGEAGRLNFESLPRADDPAIEGVAAKLIAALNLEAERVQGHSATQGTLPAEGAVAAPPVKSIALQGVSVAAASHVQDVLGPIAASHVQAAPKAGAAFSSASSSAQAPPAQDVHEGQFELTAVDGSPSGTGFAGARSIMTGTAGADTMIGTAQGDTIAGGAGNDYIDGRGAGPGQIDRIDGGAGDDRIVMNARVVASGSAGADTFLISANEPTNKAEALLGVVLDYSAAKGDHLAVLGAGHVTVVSATAVGDVLAAQGLALGEATAAQVTDVTKAVAGTRVGFDLNGDGREDVFILLGGATTSNFKLNTTIANDHTDVPVPLVGQPSSADIAGHASDQPGPR